MVGHRGADRVTATGADAQHANASAVDEAQALRVIDGPPQIGDPLGGSSRSRGSSPLSPFKAGSKVTATNPGSANRLA